MLTGYLSDDRIIGFGEIIAVKIVLVKILIIIYN